MLRLTVSNGPHAGKEFTFEGRDSFLVGRSKEAHLRLPDDDPFVSRRHFLLETNPPRCRVLDLNSRNGIEVNGQRVTMCELAHGDRIQAGQTEFLLEVVSTEPTEPTATFHDVGETPSGDGTLRPSDVARIQSLLVVWQLRQEAGEVALAEDLCPPDAPYLLQPLKDAIAGHKRVSKKRKKPGLPDIPGYDVIEAVGKGGMGVVWKAIRHSDGMEAAIKVIVPAVAGCSRHIDRIVREAKILGQLRHPNVVRLLDAGDLDGALYIAMELINGPDAEAVVKRHGPQPVERAVRLVRQALSGIAHAHEAGYVHRDIKPSNLLLAREGTARIVKVADFGLARAFEQSRMSGLTLFGEVGGTPAFMPPEQVTHYREVTPLADQYSTAATLYYMLAGRPIFDLPPDNHGKMLMVLEGKPVPLMEVAPNVPPELARIIHKALSRDPENRYPDIHAFRAELKPFSNQPVA